MFPMITVRFGTGLKPPPIPNRKSRRRCRCTGLRNRLAFCSHWGRPGFPGLGVSVEKRGAGVGHFRAGAVLHASVFVEVELLAVLGEKRPVAEAGVGGHDAEFVIPAGGLEFF